MTAFDVCKLVTEYDDLLRHWEGNEQVLLSGDVAEIDAAYDRMVEAAKAAAQADYETRIRSAITLQGEPVGEISKELLEIAVGAFDSNVGKGFRAALNAAMLPTLAHQPVTAEPSSLNVDAIIARVEAEYLADKHETMEQALRAALSYAHQPVTAGLEKARQILVDRADWHSVQETMADGMDFASSAKHHAVMYKELRSQIDLIDAALKSEGRK